MPSQFHHVGERSSGHHLLFNGSRTTTKDREAQSLLRKLGHLNSRKPSGHLRGLFLCDRRSRPFDHRGNESGPEPGTGHEGLPCSARSITSPANSLSIPARPSEARTSALTPSKDSA